MITRRPLLRQILQASRYGLGMFNEKFNRDVDYYAVLGVARTANEQQIKQAFYRLAKEYHPDSKKGFEDKFKQVNEAYTVLSDSSARRDYDQVRAYTTFKQKYTRGTAAQGERQQGGQAQQNYYQGNADWNARRMKREYQDMDEQDREYLRKYFQGTMLRLVGLSIGWVLLHTLFSLAEAHEQPARIHQQTHYKHTQEGRPQHRMVWNSLANNLSDSKHRK